MSISVGGVGNSFNSLIQSNHGIFQVRLPLFNNSDTVFIGVFIDWITVKFHHYPLKGKVQDHVIVSYSQHRGDPRVLLKLPQFVGGHSDFMVGIRCLRYYPEKVLQLPSDLIIHRIWFKNDDGTRGVIGGPQKVFTEIESPLDLHM